MLTAVTSTTWCPSLPPAVLFEGIPAAVGGGGCEGCGGVRFLMCVACNGSCKVLDSEDPKKSVRCEDFEDDISLLWFVLFGLFFYDLSIGGERERKTKQTIHEVVKRDLNVKGLSVDMIHDRAQWRRMIHVADPT
ncbi:hypothetical protein PIB30_024186 [Stylosanthes scabra]|uniref:Uncharacterized protein n=1 Tax=Stylosanthes scabra TaxID=79078 RepID=A0ABU6Z6A7_9FABA|nr:hypothetical protein [Stylosanthes scabra]